MSDIYKVKVHFITGTSDQLSLGKEFTADEFPNVDVDHLLACGAIERVGSTAKEPSKAPEDPKKNEKESEAKPPQDPHQEDPPEDPKVAELRDALEGLDEKELREYAKEQEITLTAKKPETIRAQILKAVQERGIE